MSGGQRATLAAALTVALGVLGMGAVGLAIVMSGHTGGVQISDGPADPGDDLLEAQAVAACEQMMGVPAQKIVIESSTRILVWGDDPKQSDPTHYCYAFRNEPGQIWQTSGQ